MTLYSISQYSILKTFSRTAINNELNKKNHVFKVIFKQLFEDLYSKKSSEELVITFSTEK